MFFTLAYVLSWAVWGSALAQQRGLIDWAVPAEPFGFLAVTVAAVAATAFFGGWLALRAFGTRLVRWRVPVRWSSPPAARPPSQRWLRWVSFSRAGEHDIHALVPPSATLPLLLSQVVTHLLTEEAGWRGVALPHLCPGLGSLPTGVVLGLLWAGWHIPLFFLDGTRQPDLPVHRLRGHGRIHQRRHGLGLGPHPGQRPDRRRVPCSNEHRGAVLNVVWGDLRLFWLCAAFTDVIALIVATRQVSDAHRTPIQAPEAAPAGEAVSA